MTTTAGTKPHPIFLAGRWVESDDKLLLKRFVDANRDNVAEDYNDAPVFLARNEWQLNRATQDWKGVRFLETREQTKAA